MYDICCIGHITLDKVITNRGEKHMAGGTSFYFSNALRNMDVNYCLVTALAASEIRFVEELRAMGTEVIALPSKHTVYFENNYADSLDHRTQRVLQTADPFSVDELRNVNADIFHLGPLLADDIPLALIKELGGRARISLDVQGYLRKVEDKQVQAVDWEEKKEALQYVEIVKADESELQVLTATNSVRRGAEMLAEWGVKEVVITFNSKGSLVYANNIFYDIPAFVPAVETDATGCGDTYMAGYLYQRVKGASVQDAGEFGAAMASLKIESSGPFTGTKEAVLLQMEKSKTYNTTIN
ncbi:PfkB family carbohydrate kinase [Ferruginibacter paludis]|uniref:PfkB family carbohydrate kinase n=1 Tax=Ferruginibacter paludis TaxID=1310417 RepID=UPI0025B2D29E|nr:PfkB family carbohydrate kinase [Ferruginibacter paludis]MDN3654807.1 PfkB family carbohydrate kinase [Ferruginibacter paludis]